MIMMLMFGWFGVNQIISTLELLKVRRASMAGDKEQVRCHTSNYEGRSVSSRTTSSIQRQ